MLIYRNLWKLILLLFVLCKFVISIRPRCQINDEMCYEQLMHPNINEWSSNTKHKNYNNENNPEFWLNVNNKFIKEKLNNKLNMKRAKNIIFFMGDGMSLTTLAAARQLLGGLEKKLSFEKFPFVGLAKTYSIDKIVSDSASTAMACLCGVKTMEGTIGLNGKVRLSDCHSGTDPKNFVDSIAKWAIDDGKNAGLITTTRVTHSSPAAVFAHIANSLWENDNAVKMNCGINNTIKDIAYQLINGEVGKQLKLIMGGGKENFIDKKFYNNGKRSDNLNLIKQFQNENIRNLYIENRDELMKMNLSKANRILGLYQDSHMLYNLETNNENNQPTLEEMTRKSIEFLQMNKNGYFIFIEGGRIDMAHHENRARLALDETIEFAKAIETARQMTNESDTLIVVTSDHSHAFSYAGYCHRDDDIFGSTMDFANDNKPYTILSYANGPSFKKFFDSEKNNRIDPTSKINGNKYDMFPSIWPISHETHGGDDVAVFASGPWSHLFTGVYEQNAIPHMMAYASCLGNGLKMCL